MSKIVLVIVFVSSASFENIPDISISNFFSTMSECQQQLDNIKKDFNPEEVFLKNNNRILKLTNREMHQEGFIYWSCNKKS